MNFLNLEEILKDQPEFRKKQVKQAVFKDLISSWQEAKWLPKDLRERLGKEVPLKIKAQDFFSKDKKTIKALITLDNGLKVESVLMRHNKRNTVCVSSQVGCPLGCLFCATGKMGFKRNLTSEEIVMQVLHFARFMRVAPLRVQPSKGNKVDNVVFMGMGEPFLNYENVASAIKTINDPESLGIGARHISISTVGIIEGIKRLAREKLQVNLAVSLHAPNNELRSRLMPINKKYSIEKIMDAVADYIQRTNRKVMFEYLMIKDLNDSKNLAYELVNLIKKFKKPLVMVNLIKYNLTGDFKPSTTETIQQFKKILIDNGVFVTERYRFGQDIKAACGQLAGKLPKV